MTIERPKTHKKIFPHKSFYLTPSDRDQLEYLTKVYGLNESAVIRRLITEAYAIIRYVKQGKE